MFRLVETLYGLQIKASAAPLWHDDVRFFDIREANGKLVGQFYLDMYARNSKRGGHGWTTRSRDAAWLRESDAGRLPELQFLRTCRGKPAVFTHDE